MNLSELFSSYSTVENGAKSIVFTKLKSDSEVHDSIYGNDVLEFADLLWKSKSMSCDVRDLSTKMILRFRIENESNIISIFPANTTKEVNMDCIDRSNANERYAMCIRCCQSIISECVPVFYEIETYTDDEHGGIITFVFREGISVFENAAKENMYKIAALSDCMTIESYNYDEKTTFAISFSMEG